MTGDNASKDPEDTQESHRPDSSSPPEPGSELTGGFPHVFEDEKIAIGVIIGVIVIFVAVGWYIAPRQSKTRLETGAVNSLRRIGQSQLAYNGPNGIMYGEKNYGTLDALVNNGYFQQGTTLENMIDGYRLRWKLGLSVPSFNSEWFTVIAFPHVGFETLRTFAITDSQILREFNPDVGSTVENIGTWDSVTME